MLIAMFATVNTFGQTDSYFDLSYGTCIPLGKTSDYINRPSFRGLELGYGIHLNSSISAGIDLGYHTFSKMVPDLTFDYKEFTVTGTQFRYIDNIPIHAMFRGYMASGFFKPYAGLGIGTSWNQATTQAGIFEGRNHAWQFSLAPEVGFQYEAGARTLVGLKVKYSYAAPAGGLDAVSSLNIAFTFVLE